MDNRYEQEQAEEIEVLKSIYFDQFDEKDLSSDPKVFHIQVQPFSSDEFDDVNHVIASIKFLVASAYPDIVPDVSVYSVKGLTNKDCEELKVHLDQLAQTLLGSPMIFALTSAAQEWLLQHNDRLTREQEEDEGEDSEQQEELNRFVSDREAFGKMNAAAAAAAGGTPVTEENFAAWKVQFDEKVKKEREKTPVHKWPGEMTGREYFEKKNSKLLENIIAAAQNAAQQGEEEEELNLDDFGEDVEFDESVFLDD